MVKVEGLANEDDGKELEYEPLLWLDQDVDGELDHLDQHTYR